MTKISIPSPIFDIGEIPFFPNCKIYKREYRKDGKWYYAIINSYNPYGSGWADEDWIINQIKEHNRKNS